MKLRKTAKIKLDIQKEEILHTFTAYTAAFNLVCQTGYPKKIYNGITLHEKTYTETRKTLPSQLAISARTKATKALAGIFSKKGKAAIRRAKQHSKNPEKKNQSAKCPQSKLCSIRLDINSYSLFLEKSEISLLTVNGRKRYKLIIPEYYQGLFDDWKYTSAELCIKKNTVYINITFEKEVTDIPHSGKLLGIDRGINNLAVTSDCKFYGGKKVKQQVRKYQYLRRKLKAKGSKSAKRHLKKLSGKERRFRADINHCIAKNIISSLKPGDYIVLENLTGIRSQRLCKTTRILINTWGFDQLEEFLKYKGAEKGILVVFVSARHTSQRSSRCGSIDKKNRKNQSQFCCKKCNFKLNADLNAARNISLKYLDSSGYPGHADVNRRIVSAAMSDTSLHHAKHGVGS